MLHSSRQRPTNPANGPSARFFSDIGILPGMRVLDVGCGNGDLSRLVAALTGPTGEVIAVDQSDGALALARNIEADQQAAPIRYSMVNLEEDLPDLGCFDVIVGRRVLMYLPDAARTLERLAGVAKPGAILAFQEHARTQLPAGLGELKLHNQLYDWMWSTVAAEGGDVFLALRLVSLLKAMGLSVEQARSEAILLQLGEPSFLPVLAQAMLPRFVERGIVSPAELDPDTLEQRIEEERSAAGGTIVWDLAFLVSARMRAAAAS